MGKKKIKKQTEEELLKESATIQKTAEKMTVSAQGGSASGGKIGRQIVRGRIYIQVSYNNTFITVTDEKGDVLAWSSAGSLGFKGPKKATPYAASKVAEAIIEKIKKNGFAEVEVFVTGIGSGRESAVRSLANHGLNIVYIKDTTPIPHNGPRPKKVRRV
jgi:small subunit ribosomal protein S11